MACRHEKSNWILLGMYYQICYFDQSLFTTPQRASERGLNIASRNMRQLTWARLHATDWTILFLCCTQCLKEFDRVQEHPSIDPFSRLLLFLSVGYFGSLGIQIYHHNPNQLLWIFKITKFMPKKCQTTLLLSLPSAHNAQCWWGWWRRWSSKKEAASKTQTL